MGHLGVTLLTVDEFSAAVYKELFCLASCIIVGGLHAVVTGSGCHRLAVCIKVCRADQSTVFIIFA